MQISSQSRNGADAELVKPYAMVGAGKLASSIWKRGSEEKGWCYRFNVLRLSSDGHAGQLFRPSDLTHFVKLARVLAAVIADDGCISDDERQTLKSLIRTLDDWAQANSQWSCLTPARQQSPPSKLGES